MVKAVSSPPVTLRVRELSVCTRTIPSKKLLAEVNLELIQGQRLGILGVSGAGKSIFLQALTGFYPNSLTVQGSVELILNNNEVINLLELDLSRRHQLVTTTMAISWQNSLQALNPYQNIGYQLGNTLGLRHHVNREQKHALAIQWLNQVGLTSDSRLLKQYPHQLSGGMRQRVAIAMAMCGGQPIVIADEPTTALDVINQAECIDLYDRLCATESRSLIYVSHDLALVSQLCTEVLVLDHGRVIESGSVQQVFNNPVSEQVKTLIAHTRQVRPA